MSADRLSRRTLLKGAAGATAGATAAVTPAATRASGGSSRRSTYRSHQSAPPKREGDKLEFTYLRPTWGPATYTKDGAYETTLEELGNVEIDVQIIPVIDFDTKVNTTLASGDIPDVIWGQIPSIGIWRESMLQGGFAPLNEHLDKYPAVRDAVPASIWEILTAEDGNIYFVPNLIWPVVPFFLFYRQDLFEQTGIAEPTSVDEFVTTLGTLKEQFPDQSPFSMGYEWHAKDLATTREFTERGWEPTADDPNALEPWFAKQVEIDFYFWLQDLHKQGLIDQNYGTSREPNFSTDRFKGNQVVIAIENWLSFPDIVTNLRQVAPEAKVGVLPPLAPSAGTRTVFPVDRGFYLSATMENPDGFFNFLNWTLTDASDLRRYGVEGKTYTLSGDQKVPIPDVDRETDYKGPQIEPLSFLAPFSEKLDFAQMQLSFESSGVGDQFEYIKGKYEEYDRNEYPDYRNPMVISPTEVESGTRLYEDYLRATAESVVYNHDLTPEDWAEKVQSWMEAGGADIIAEVNANQEDKSKPDYKV
ncbi:MAG: extracellular solute-binding protein [Thermomicrobiales bacterium]